MITRALIVVAILASPAAAQPPSRVIPAEQGERVGLMLGVGAGEIGGCVLDTASIDKTLVRAKYTCGADTVELTLVHPDAAEAPLGKTEKLAITGVAPAPLVEGLLSRIREQEAEFAWAEVVPGRGGKTAGFSPSVPLFRLVGATDEQQAKYEKAVELYKQDRAEEAYALLYEVAQHVQQGVLGTLVAALASSHPTPQWVEELGRRADANPDDPLPNFVAGVAAHYYGHQSGSSVEEKQRYYRMAIPWLERAKEKYVREPRVWIYLAVSHFRTGEQAKAEEEIEKAVALGRHDADAFYCRAEIWHRKDPQKAVDDMKEYLKIMDENRARGSFWSEGKEKRVRDMLAHMERVARGELKPDAAELFDPIHDRFTGNVPTSTVAGIVAGVALLGLAAVVLARMRRKRAA
ncbi:MAG: hypothetical protein AMXMBFR64_30620 [Myxococcales bacterium]